MPNTECRVDYKREGLREQVRLFQMRYYAERYAARLATGSPDLATLEYVTISERPVGDWRIVMGNWQPTIHAKKDAS